MNRLRTGQALSPLDLSDRADKVRSQISKREAIVVMDASNVQWMTGFTGSNGTVYIDHERFVLITDQRYQEQGPLQVMQTGSTAELSISKNSIEDLSKLAGRKTIKLDSNQVTWATAARLGEILGGDIVPSDPLNALRAQKDQCEIERISLAAKIVDQALKDTVPLFSQKISEMEIAMHLDEEYNIAIRSGMHCVHSWFNSRSIEGTARASVYLYNNEADVIKFTDAIEDTIGS